MCLWRSLQRCVRHPLLHLKDPGSTCSCCYGHPPLVYDCKPKQIIQQGSSQAPHITKLVGWWMVPPLKWQQKKVRIISSKCKKKKKNTQPANFQMQCAVLQSYSTQTFDHVSLQDSYQISFTRGRYLSLHNLALGTQNHLDRKKTLRSSSPTVNLTYRRRFWAIKYY